MGYDLNVAEYKEVYLTERDMWRYTQQFLMQSKHTTSYKFVLMKAILECLPEITSTNRLTFEQVTRHVTKIYWNLVIPNKLRHCNSEKAPSDVEQILRQFQQEYVIPDTWNYDFLPEEKKSILVTRVNRMFKKYVYGSLYGAFSGTIYSFNKKEEWIELIRPYVDFFSRYKTIVMNVTNYQMAVFLEKFHTSEVMEKILTKVEFISARSSLEDFRAILVACGEDTCFYCYKPLRKIHVAHFIPWSYVQNDVLWNFVLTCPTCNSSKK